MYLFCLSWCTRLELVKQELLPEVFDFFEDFNFSSWHHDTERRRSVRLWFSSFSLFAFGVKFDKSKSLLGFLTAKQMRVQLFNTSPPCGHRIGCPIQVMWHFLPVGSRSSCAEMTTWSLGLTTPWSQKTTYKWMTWIEKRRSVHTSCQFWKITAKGLRFLF